MSKNFTLFLANPRGFCAGVERAIATVNSCLEKFGAPIYVLHEIVHNKHVIKQLSNAGAIFVEHLADIPTGKVTILSAHGVSKAVEEYGKALELRIVNATCPLVTSVHRMVERYHQEGCDVLIIGHHNHPEVEGTAGRVKNGVQVIATEQEAEEIEVEDYSKVGYVTQTTLTPNDIAAIIAILKRRFPKIRGPKSNICFATQNRQDAVRELAKSADLVLVVGSKNSSNSNRLKEVAMRQGVLAHLIDDHRDIRPEWFLGNVQKIGITAGASAPERLVKGVITWFSEHGDVEVKQLEGVIEDTHFKPACLKT